MLSIRSAFGTFDLEPGTRIRLVYQYPDPELGILHSEYTYWFDLPDTANNRRLLQFPIIGNFAQLSVQCELHIYTNSGVLMLRQFSNRRYRAMIQFQGIASILPHKLSSLVQDSISLGTTTPDILAAARTISTVVSPSAKVAFPCMQAPEFSPESAWQGTINRYEADAYADNSVEGNINHLVPLPYLNYIIQRAAYAAGYTYTGHFAANAWANKLLVLSNYNADRTSRNGYVVVSAEAWFTGSNPQRIVNSFDTVIQNVGGEWNNPGQYIAGTEGGYYEYSVSFSGTTFYRYPIRIILSGDTVSEIIASETTTGQVRAAGFFETPLTSFTIYLYLDSEFNAPDLGWVHEDSAVADLVWSVRPVSRWQQNRFANSLSVANLMPDITLQELLHGIASKFTLAVFFDNTTRRLHIDFYDNLLRHTSAYDITSLVISDSVEYTWPSKDYSFQHNTSFEVPELGDLLYIGEYNTVAELPAPPDINTLAYILAENAYYVVQEQELESGFLALAWVLYADNYQAFGTGDTVIASQFETTRMRLSGTQLTPTTDMTGRSSNYPWPQTNAELALLFYHGMQSDANGLPYPMASSTYTDAEGNILDGIALSWHTPGDTRNLYNLAESFYTNQQRKLLQANLHPQPELLQLIRMFEPNAPRNRIRYQNTLHRPVRLDIVIDSTGIREAQIQGV
jgi:hypothetical protein